MSVASEHHSQEMQDVIRRAVLVERERCAKIAENPGFIQAQDTEWDEGVNYAKRFIAEAIRHPTRTAMTEIAAGKFYKSRDGRIVGPMVWDDVTEVWRNGPDFVRNTGDYWHKDGSRLGHVGDDYDLVEEAAFQVNQ